MASTIFSVVALDQYAEKHLSPNTLHLSPWPSLVSKRSTGLIHLRYTLLDWEIYSDRYKTFHTTFN